MADRPTDTLSLIYLVAAAVSSRPRFNRSHLLMSDGPLVALPSPPACPVWWSRHCLFQFIWLQMSLITYLNCIMAKISSEIKPHLERFLHAEFCNPGQAVWQNLYCLLWQRMLTKEIHLEYFFSINKEFGNGMCRCIWVVWQKLTYVLWWDIAKM